MASSAGPRTYPALPVLIVVLLGTLTLAGGGLLLALNQIFASQIESAARSAGQRQFEYLKESFTQMLWEYNREEAKAVATAVTRGDDVLALSLVTDQDEVVFQESRPGPSFQRLSAPLVRKDVTVGTLTIDFSSRSLDQQRTAVTGFAVAVFLAFILILGAVLPSLLNRTVLRPFNRLSGHLGQDTGTGAFPYLPEPSSRIREIRLLETALASLNRAVARQVEDLETRVLERTRELEAAQAAVIHAETMATLGQLAAGIAHELNTPLAAIGSTVRFLQGQWKESLVPVLAHSVRYSGTADPLDYLTDSGNLAADLDLSPAPGVQRILRRRWESLGRAADTPLADLVCETGLSSRMEEIALWPEAHEANRAVELVAVWGRSLSILGSAAEKSTAVVSALRSQVHVPQTRAPRPLELRREIGQALILLQNQTRNGVQVHLDAPEEVWVLGEPEEFGKVWLNLLLNAIQAMDGVGNLSIAIANQESWAVVDFSNDGPPIPPSLVTRIFEPFFTTKSTGMGLGLAITRKVIEQNHGRLEVECVPGRTTFRVFLVRVVP